MWDRHWCARAAIRMRRLAVQIETATCRARAAGIHIIHAPSNCMPFYADYPERRHAANLSPVCPPMSQNNPLPPIPIDDPDEGFEPGTHQVTRQNVNITIAPGDIISDDVGEIYSFIRHCGIEALFYAGVHSNKCIMDRSFGIRSMVAAGVTCVLLRDLTDAIYNPSRPPYVSRESAAEMVIEHIEQYWCSTMLSDDLVAACAFAADP
jgi:nicotinamidase-related amidase